MGIHSFHGGFESTFSELRSVLDAGASRERDTALVSIELLASQEKRSIELILTRVFNYGYAECNRLPQWLSSKKWTQETCVRSLGWIDSLEWEMATHCSVFAWEIPWTEELEGL